GGVRTSNRGRALSDVRTSLAPLPNAPRSTGEREKFPPSRPMFLRLYAIARAGDRLAHGGVGLDVLQAVIIHHAQVPAAEGLGDGAGDLGLGQNDRGAVLRLLGDVLLLLGDGHGAALLGLGLEAAFVGFRLI